MAARRPIAASSSGGYSRACPGTVARLPEQELEAFLASDTYRGKPARTFPSEEDLRKQLQEIRGNRWCRSSGELDAGLGTLAIPVRDRRGDVVAGLDICTHTGEYERWDETGEISHRLRACAAAIGSDVHPAHLSQGF
ncbi:IclR family transcriptional regulator C-terminal domain-containing protein [Nocardia sp. NPDC058499]|uniref:IclR family transcriptional regulator domain-containing protein n=1 Tax=Nocardia sp. NPDC058499 TaxID=3346530 RepID=UPI003669E688